MRVLLAITHDAGLHEALRAGIGEDDVLIAEADMHGAERRLIALRVDCILVDDGAVPSVEAIDTLHAAAPQTPVVVLASRGGLAEQAELRRAGADDILVKPFTSETLRIAIAGNTSRAARETEALLSPTPASAACGSTLAQYQRALRWLSRAAARQERPDAVAERLAEGILDIFDAVRCAVLLEVDGRVSIAASHGIPESVCGTLSLGYTQGIMRSLDARASLLLAGDATPDAQREMAVLHAEAVVPLLREGRVFGALVVGERATGPYSPEDLELLSLVARSAASLFADDTELESALKPVPQAKPVPAEQDVDESPFWEYLSSRVAQEIKNPMVAINTFAQLLPRKYESEEFREAFSRVVQQEVGRINNVVETLFSFARHPEPERRTCSIHEAVSDALRVFEEELKARNIELETQWEDGGAQVEVDPIYFSKALHNVLQNAIDAMPEGGRIRVETRRENGTADVVVKDSGPGVEPGDEAQIFLPFFSTRERGMGLGLPIANRILKQHGGRLALLREASGGSAFLLQVPASSTASGTDAAPEH